MYNEGLRKNNSDIMMAGRTVFTPLFYIGHHPKYQHILLRDLIERVNYPPPVKEYMDITESHTASGLPTGGQGDDFIHEELNKTIKSYLQGSGIPTKQMWVNIICKAKIIGSLKDAFIKTTDVDTVNGKKRPKKFEHEINMIRKEIRICGYLDRSSDPVSLEYGSIQRYHMVVYSQW